MPAIDRHPASKAPFNFGKMLALQSRHFHALVMVRSFAEQLHGAAIAVNKERVAGVSNGEVFRLTKTNQEPPLRMQRNRRPSRSNCGLRESIVLFFFGAKHPHAEWLLTITAEPRLTLMRVWKPTFAIGLRFHLSSYLFL